MNNPLDKSYYIDFIIINLVLLFLLADTITGVAIKYNLPSVSQPFKIVLMSLMLLRIMQNSVMVFVFLFGIISLFFIPVIFVFYSTGGNTLYFAENLSGFLKISNLFVSFFYFKNIFFQRFYERKSYFFMKIISYSYFFVFLNLILGLLGFGYEAYAGGIGSNGFFYSTNEVSTVMIIFHSVFLFYIFETSSPKKYVLFGLGLVFLSLVKASKVSIVGTFLIFILVPIVNYKLNIRRLKLTDIKYGCVSLLILILASSGIYYGMEQSGLLDRMIYFYTLFEGNLVTFLLSSRDEFVAAGLIQFQKSNFFEILFGLGSKSAQDLMIPIIGVPKTMEVDFFDILFAHGIIGVVIIFTFMLSCTSIAYKRWKMQGDVKFLMLVVCNLLVLVISFTAGHVFTGGMVTLFIGLVNGYVLTRKNTELLQ